MPITPPIIRKSANIDFANPIKAKFCLYFDYFLSFLDI